MVNTAIVLLVVSAIAVSSIVNERRRAALEHELRLQAEAIAEESRKSVDAHRYAANIRLAWQAWNRSGFDQMRDALSRCHPAKGEADLRGFEWHYLRRLQWSLPEPLAQHDGAVYFARYAPDGAALATAGRDGVRLWGPSPGESLAHLTQHAGDVNWLSFSPDGALLATAGDDRAVRIWNTTTWEVERTLSTETFIVAAEFSPDGDLLAVAERSNPPRAADFRAELNRVTLYGTDDWEPRGAFASHSEPIQSVAFSSDGSLMATAASDGLARVWDLASGTTLFEAPRHGGGVSCVAFSPSLPLLATAARDHRVRLWDLGELRSVPLAVLEGHLNGVECVTFTSDGDTILTAGRDGAVCVWDTPPRTLEQPMLAPRAVLRHESPLWCVTPARSGNAVVATDGAGRVTRWVLSHPSAQHPIRLKPDAARPWCHFTFAPDGKRLLAGSGAALVYGFQGGRITCTTLPEAFHVIAVGTSPDGRWFAAGSRTGDVWLWDALTLDLIRRWEPDQLGWPPPHSATQVEFAPDSRSLLVVRTDDPDRWHPPLRLDVRTGAILSDPGLPEDEISYVGYSPDGRWVTTLTFNSRIDVRSLIDKERHAIDVSGGAFGFSPDMRQFVVGGYDGTVHLWDARDWSKRLIFVTGAATVQGLAFAPDGRTLAVSADGELKLYNAAAGRELLTLPTGGGSRKVRHVAFSPDGRTLAAELRGEPAEVLVWSLDRFDR